MLEIIAWSVLAAVGFVVWFTIGAVIRPYLVAFSNYMIALDDVSEVTDIQLWRRKFRDAKKAAGGYKIFQALFWPLVVIIAGVIIVFCLFVSGWEAIDYYGNKLP